MRRHWTDAEVWELYKMATLQQAKNHPETHKKCVQKIQLNTTQEEV